jgi:hypothetical protein
VTNYINFKELNQRLKTEDVIDLLRFDGKREGQQFRAFCTGCKSKDHRALSINLQGGVFRWFFPARSNSSEKEGRRNIPIKEDTPPDLDERINELERRVTELEEARIVRLRR